MEVRRKPESASSSVPIQAIIQERLLDGSAYDSVSVQALRRYGELCIAGSIQTHHASRDVELRAILK